MHRVFVYGTLQRNEPNHYLLADQEDINTGKVVFLGYGRLCEKRPLVIATIYNVPFLLDKTGYGEHVIGELYDVSDSILEKLDELEAHPELYLRTKVNVEQITSPEPSSASTSLTEAWCYLLPHRVDELLEIKPYIVRYSTDHSKSVNKAYVESEELDSVEDLIQALLPEK